MNLVLSFKTEEKGLVTQVHICICTTNVVTNLRRRGGGGRGRVFSVLTQQYKMS